MWSRRAQEYEAKISSGKIYELAEVVRDLNKGDDQWLINPTVKDNYLKKLMKNIVRISNCIECLSRGHSKKTGQSFKRNLGGNQQPPIATTTSKTSTSDLPTEEPLSDADEPEPIED